VAVAPCLRAEQMVFCPERDTFRLGARDPCGDRIRREIGSFVNAKSFVVATAGRWVYADAAQGSVLLDLHGGRGCRS
jgi:hypothetical protein